MKSVVKDADPQGLDSAGNKIQETRQKAFNGLDRALMGKDRRSCGLLLVVAKETD